MADINFLVKSTEKFMSDYENKKKEKEGEEKKEMFAMNNSGDSSVSFVSNFMSLLIFVLAFYLSWVCNSKSFPQMNIVEKLMRGFIAGIFGFFYLILYFIFWANECNKPKGVINPTMPIS